jgi:hypothetical protein
MNGVYICDQSQKKADTTHSHGTWNETFVDFTCTIKEIDFKRNSTVELKMQQGSFVTNYIKDKDYIRVKGTGGDILFKLINNKTLIGEGIFEGQYHKK